MVNAATNTFSAKDRLSVKRRFSDVHNKPQRIYGSFFKIIFWPNCCNRPRLGIAIAKKKYKSAVFRNSFKRLVRESFRVNKKGLPPIDIVVAAKDNITKAKFDIVRKELRNIWQRLV